MPPSTYAVEVGCEIGHARELVYADGISLDNGTAAADKSDEKKSEGTSKAKPDGADAGDAGKEAKKPAAEDYQLGRALDLLRGLSLFSERIAAKGS